MKKNPKGDKKLMWASNLAHRRIKMRSAATGIHMMKLLDQLTEKWKEYDAPQDAK